MLNEDIVSFCFVKIIHFCLRNLIKFFTMRFYAVGGTLEKWMHFQLSKCGFCKKNPASYDAGWQPWAFCQQQIWKIFDGIAEMSSGIRHQEAEEVAHLLCVSLDSDNIVEVRKGPGNRHFPSRVRSRALAQNWEINGV